MHVRNHTPEDYETFCKWWHAWGWPAISYAFLPQNSIVVCDEEPICAVFLYQTDTPIVWAENYISDKDSPLRKQALPVLIAAIQERAKDMGAAAVMSAVKHNVLARRLEGAGFVKGDENLTNYILAV